MSNPKVLLVDDETRFRTTLSKRLKARGKDVVILSGGEEAIDEIQKSDYDVVILDVRMPGLDGLETLVAMKKLKPEMEVILLTGHASLESSKEGIGLGAFDYVLKPCDIDVLLEKIQQAYEHKASVGKL